MPCAIVRGCLPNLTNLRPGWTVSVTGIAIPFPEPDAMLIHPLKKIEKICVNDKTAHQVAARVAAKAEK